MNEIGNKIKQDYDSVELPEELRQRTRREFLEAAETKTERSISMSKGIKKPVAAIAIAAAALTVGITAGAAKSGVLKFNKGVQPHKESIDTQLGEGAADTIASNIKFDANSIENEYLRITADAVFYDGNSMTVFVTTERLKDPYTGWVYENGFWNNEIYVDVEYADGSWVSGYSRSSNYLEPTDDGVTYERYTIDKIEEGKAVTLTFNDYTDWDAMYNKLDEEGIKELFARKDYEEYHNRMIHPASVYGLSLTIDATQNVTPIVFADDNGNEVYLTPYNIYTYSYGINSFDLFGLTLENSSTGEKRSVPLSGGAASMDFNGYDFADYVEDIDQYDIFVVENLGTFYKK